MSTVRLDLVDLHHKFLAQLENICRLTSTGSNLTFQSIEAGSSSRTGFCSLSAASNLCLVDYWAYV